MIAIFTGPDAARAAQVWASDRSPTLWLSYDDADTPEGVSVMAHPPYEPLATYAQRRRFPKAKTDDLFITNLDCLRHGIGSTRNPAPVDFNGCDDLQRLSQLAARGAGLHRTVIFSSMSRFYDQTLVRVGRGLAGPHADKVAEFGRALVAEALTAIVCDLRDAGCDVGLIAHPIPVRNRTELHLPVSLTGLAHVVGSCESGILTIKHSSLASVPEGTTLAIDDHAVRSDDVASGVRLLPREDHLLVG